MNDSSNWKFIVRNLYSLKRQYGAEVTVCKVLDVETDYITGEKTISRELHEVRRAIMLPVEEKRKVEQGIAHLSSNKMFASQAGFDDEQALFIFDTKDLPAGFQFNLDDFVIVEDEYFRVTEVDEYEYDSGWVIKTHRTKGADFVLQPPPPPDFEGVATTFGTLPGDGITEWWNGGIADNGMIYVPPQSASTILKIDPLTDTYSTIGNVAASSSWRGIVQAANGNLYSMPTASKTVLKIDPTTDSVSEIGTFSPGSVQMSDTILAPNGMIYGVPQNNAYCHKFDPNSEVLSTIGPLLSGPDRWNGGVLAPNDCIYGVPYNVSPVLKINTVNDDITTFGSLAGTYKWINGCVVGDYIYCSPVNATTILKINWTNDTLSTFGNFPGTGKWSDLILAPDGYIYGIPFRHTQILRIDPSDDSTLLFDATPTLGDGPLAS
jgi:hypothetical protein